MKKYLIIIVLAVMTSEINAQGSNEADKPKEYSIVSALLKNHWHGTGVLMGKEATFSMDWQWVLTNRFLKLEFQNKRKSKAGEDIVFQATAFYKIENDIVVGHWFDNRGVTFPLKGTVKEQELTILWGNEETEMGKTLYTLTDNNEITVEDFIMNNGNYIKFGSATYHKNN